MQQAWKLLTGLNYRAVNTREQQLVASCLSAENGKKGNAREKEKDDGPAEYLGALPPLSNSSPPLYEL